MSNYIDEAIKRVFCESLCLDEQTVTDSTSYNNIEVWDSLKHLQMVSAFEEAFGIELDMDDIIAMENYAEVKNIIKKYLEKKAR